MKKDYDIKRIIKEKKLIPKTVCLLLAIILWFYVSIKNINEITIKLPVTAQGLNEDYVISSISSKIITAKISGHKDEIKNIKKNNIKTIVDLSTAEIGNYKIYPIECKIDFENKYEITLNPEKKEISSAG